MEAGDGFGDEGVRGLGMWGWLTSVSISIREFCELDTPIIMFGKDGAFAVATLKEVRGVPFTAEK